VDCIEKRRILRYSFVTHKINLKENTPMKNTIKFKEFSTDDQELLSPIDLIIREGVQKILQAAIEAEINEHLSRYKNMTDNNGHRIVVKNGYKQKRNILTGVGPLEIHQPRVDDRKLTDYGIDRFSSKILPPFMRRVPTIDKLVPVLYLHGISTDDFPKALESIIGPGAKGLSANTIVRLKRIWEDEYTAWRKRDLSSKEYIYIWADGIHSKIRLDDQKSCMLVLMGVNPDGKKELIAVEDGYRESKQSWKELLLSLKSRGLKKDPKLAIGDGALGFWSALREVFPNIKEQRCWVHKTANILDKMPKIVQPKAKMMIHDIYLAPTVKDAEKAFNLFVETYNAKYPKATECLSKDEDALFAFYSFPAKHWKHIRTTNPIESAFATVRLRTRRTKGAGSRVTALTMVWKLCQEAEKAWQRIAGYKQLPLVIEEKKFVDGELVDEAA
jgi:putative transposase